MGLALRPDARHSEPTLSTGEWLADHRTRLALEQSQRLERKHTELVSERNTPRDTNHRWLTIVAATTEPALHQVRTEQQRRSTAVTTAFAPDAV